VAVMNYEFSKSVAPSYISRQSINRGKTQKDFTQVTARI